MFTSFSKATAATSLFGLLTLAACSSAPQPKFQQELFETGASPYARNFNSSVTDTCEAARRALLSQGYLTTMTRTDTVDGTKNFQPTGDTHIVVEFHVVCTPGEEASDTSIVYVNAVQNGFALKKSDTSASVGLSVLGSLSLPIRSNSDAMVKISSETIPSGKFYDRFFGLVDHYLQTVVRTQPVSEQPHRNAPVAGAGRSDQFQRRLPDLPPMRSAKPLPCNLRAGRASRLDAMLADAAGGVLRLIKR